MTFVQIRKKSGKLVTFNAARRCMLMTAKVIPSTIEERFDGACYNFNLIRSSSYRHCTSVHNYRLKFISILVIYIDFMCASNSARSIQRKFNAPIFSGSKIASDPK
jgi:hypothetical protein